MTRSRSSAGRITRRSRKRARTRPGPRPGPRPAMPGQRLPRHLARVLVLRLEQVLEDVARAFSGFDQPAHQRLTHAVALLGLERRRDVADRLRVADLTQ